MDEAMEEGKSLQKRMKKSDSEEESSYEDVTISSGEDDDKSKADDYPFEVLSTDEIVQRMADTIREVNTVIEFPATTTRILLNHFKWDKEKLIENFYGGDQEKFFAKAHVVNPFIKKIDKSSASPSSTNEAEECGVCFMTLPTDEMSGLECGHRFCSPCWSEYFQTKIMEEGESQTIACAAHDCDILVDDATVMRLVKDPKVKLKYQHLITNSFVECSRLLKWCQTPDCNSAIKVQYVKPKPVTCKTCNNTFCFDCGRTWHGPITCDLLRKWTKKYNEDKDSLNWISANTKDCPKCQTPIEKNGGCNYMSCTNKNCKAHFCWICLKVMTEYGHAWNCNTFQEEPAGTQRSTNNIQLSRQRYEFYINRYANHEQSLKFENELYGNIELKMEDMQEHGISWIDVQFLKKAVDILCSCRQTLMYTYVFAFYLKKSNQSVIFDDNQKDLERAIENLSEYLERDIVDEFVTDIKQKVVDKYKYCESRRKALLDHCQEGYDKDWWKFI